jgi:F0F1-type ATP synthase membrane subunit c/vacuolar-type H+-ATPase subunit K
MYFVSTKIAVSIVISLLCVGCAGLLSASAAENEPVRARPDVSTELDSANHTLGSAQAAGTTGGDQPLTAEQVRAQMTIIRRSETADANNQHNLRVIDNVLGKALEILGLALGVAIVVSSVIEQRGKKEEVASIVVGTVLIMLALMAPVAIHTFCEQLAHGIFR